MPSLVKRPPIIGNKIVTIITVSIEGSSPSTTIFDFIYDASGPNQIPDIIIDSGGPGDRVA
jgi:hypothetical protein